jgi:LytS/YehU family sensor histidine kinase
VRQPAFFISGSSVEFQGFGSVFVENLPFVFFILILGITGFYLTYYFLTPLFLKKTYRDLAGIFVVWLLIPLLVVLAFSGISFAYAWFFEVYLLGAYALLFVFSTLGALLQTYNYGQLKKREKEILEKEQLQTQLALLRSKIDPHFLFNTINNIDILIESEPITASGYLRKLSDILRFTIYRFDGGKINLSEEIEYIDKYIALQRIRSYNPDFVEFVVEGNVSGRVIAPMIFIVFVENSIKFAKDREVSRVVRLKLVIKGDRLIFHAINNVGSNASNNDKEEGGIGLSSVKKRLNLLYPGKHDLEIIESDNEFQVKLLIKDL